MPDQVGLLIEEIYYARVILHIRGRIIGVEKIDPEARICLEDSFHGKVYPAHTEIEGDRFYIRYNIMNCNGPEPMSTGEYYLILENGKKRYFSYVVDKLHYLSKTGRLVFPYDDSIDQNWVQDVKRDNPFSFWQSRSFGKLGSEFLEMLSMLNLDNDRFYIQTTYRGCPKPMGVRQAWKKRWSEFKKLWNPFKESILIKRFIKFSKKRRKKGPDAKKTILFTSASRAEIGGNEGFIYDRMKERDLLKNYNIFMNFKPSISEGYGWINGFKFTKQLALADIIMIDDYHPFVYKFPYPKDVKFVQVWHACGAFKTVGLERMGKPGSPKLNSIVHKCYTHVPVSSKHSGLHCAESFGLPEEVFLPIGVPRTDVFFDEDYKKKIVEDLRKELPLITQRKRVILYAPTFRGNNANSAYFPFEQLDLEEWGAFLKERDELLIIKMHPFIKKKVEIPEAYKEYILDLSEYREVNDILFISDVLITDYSSVMYEFSLLRRPMYFYAFDQRMYEMQRDFYEPFEQTVPGNIVHTFPKLLKALREDNYDYDQLDAFIEKNFLYTDGKSTDRFIDHVILDKPLENV